MSWRHGNGRRSEKLCKNTRSAIDKWVANKVSYDKKYSNNFFQRKPKADAVLTMK